MKFQGIEIFLRSNVLKNQLETCVLRLVIGKDTEMFLWYQKNKSEAAEQQAQFEKLPILMWPAMKMVTVMSISLAVHTQGSKISKSTQSALAYTDAAIAAESDSDQNMKSSPF